MFIRITYETKPGIFDEKRGNAALLIKKSGFYFIFNPSVSWRFPFLNFLWLVFFGCGGV